MSSTRLMHNEANDIVYCNYLNPGLMIVNGSITHMPVTQPANMLVTPHTVSPMVSPIIFTIGTTIRFPGEGGRKGEREKGRNGRREEEGMRRREEGGGWEEGREEGTGGRKKRG